MNQPAPPPSVLWMIWGAMLSSVAIYGAVILLAFPNAGGGSWQTLAPVLALVSLSTTGMAFFVVPRARAPTHVQYLIRWALCESVAIFGVVIAALGAPLPVAGLFLAWGAGAIALQSPPGRRDGGLDPGE